MEFLVIILIPLLLLALAGGFIVVMQVSGFVQSSYMNRRQRFSNMLIEEYINDIAVAQNQIFRRNKELEVLSTQLALSNQQLEQLNEMRSKFLSMVVHDIRTPLASIKGFGELLGKQLVNEKQMSYYNNITTAVEQINRLVSDLTDLAMIEAGKLKIEKFDFDFSQMVNGIMPGILVNAKSKKVEIKVLENVKVIVRGDKFRISQVLMNLLNNAIKFTPEGKKVELTTKYDGKYITVYVKDNGIGIHPSERKKIFDKFYQAKYQKDEKLRKQGWGLGLTIAQEIVYQHKGEIGVESLGLGKGSTFWFKIPLR